MSPRQAAIIQNIKGNDFARFKVPASKVVIPPDELRSATLIGPYPETKQ